MMSHQFSRRSALKVAWGASLLAVWPVIGCSSGDQPKDATGKAQALEDSVLRKPRTPKKGEPAAPAPTQRVKGGPD